MCYFKLDDFLKWSMQSNHMLIIWKNQEKHCWTCLKPLSVICGYPIPHYLDYSHILQRRRKPVSNILPYSKLQFLFYDFFQSNNQKQMLLELEFLTIEQDCFTKCEVSFLQILLFHLRNPILKKTDLVFPLKLSDMLEFWLYNPQKSPILESFKG